jgi:hypothetical protein
VGLDSSSSLLARGKACLRQVEIPLKGLSKIPQPPQAIGSATAAAITTAGSKPCASAGRGNYVREFGRGEYRRHSAANIRVGNLVEVKRRSGARARQIGLDVAPCEYRD